MKLSLTALVCCAFALMAQDVSNRQLKHLSVPTPTSMRPLTVSAEEVQKETQYPSVIHLRGSVEIRTPVCTVNNSRSVRSWICDGAVVLRADEADLHEDTGEIEASGHVKVTRERSADARLGQ